jgi:hypothetical protein
MDSRDFELFANENVQLLKEFNTNLIEFKALLKQANENYVAPKDNVEVTGSVEVNTEPEVEITNMYEFTDSIDDLAKRLQLSIEDNSFEPLKEISIKNIKDAQPKDIKINNWNEAKKLFEYLGDIIKTNKPVVNVAKADIKLPTTPREAIAVKLVSADGKRFYTALESVVTALAESAETDPLVGYQPSDTDTVSSPAYFGFVKKTGKWYIMKETSGAYRYCVGGGDYATNWTNRASLTYGYFYEVF